MNNIYDIECIYCENILDEESKNFDKLFEQTYVVLEMSLNDIKAKIKELWEKFKNFFKSIKDKLLNQKRISNKKADAAILLAKKSLSKAENYDKKHPVKEAEEYVYTGKYVNYWVYNISDSNNQIKDTEKIFRGPLTKYLDSELGSSEEFANFLKTNKDQDAIQNKFKELIDNNELPESIKDIDLVNEVNGEKCRKKFSFYRFMMQELIDNSQYVKLAISFITTFISELDKQIVSAERISSTIPNPEVASIYARIAQSDITSIRMVINKILPIEHKLYSIQDHYANELLKISVEVSSY